MMLACKQFEESESRRNPAGIAFTGFLPSGFLLAWPMGGHQETGRKGTVCVR